MGDKLTKSELLAMLAEAVRNTQPQPPPSITQPLDAQPKSKRLRRSPERASKAKRVRATGRRKQQR